MLVLMPVVPFQVPSPRPEATYPVTPVYLAPSHVPVAEPPTTMLLFFRSTSEPAATERERTLLTLLAPAFGAMANVPALTASALTRTCLAVSVPPPTILLSDPSGKRGSVLPSMLPTPTSNPLVSTNAAADSLTRLRAELKLAPYRSTAPGFTPPA